MSYHFCFRIFLFQNLKKCSQIPIEDCVIFSLINKMVKCFQMLQGDAEYFGLLLIKAVIYKVGQMVTQAVFLLQCTMKSPISVYQEWFHSFEIGCKYFLMVRLCYVGKILSFFKAVHHVHVHCVHFAD